MRSTEFEGLTYQLRDDPRVSRSLTLGEFIQAFSIFKDVYCENNGHKRMQLDGHEQTVVELATMYGGTAHYDYHRLFAARVAAYAARGQSIRWDMRDTRLYGMCTSGRRTRTCAVCHSITHATEVCPSIVNSTHRPTASTSAPHSHQPSYSQIKDIRGRPRVRHNALELCNNFNSHGCTRPQGPFLHACLACFSRKHGKAACKKSSE